MKQQALGLIEAVGYTTAISAADAALKAAKVTLVGVERVIGGGGALSVTIHLSGDVAAVTSAVQAGREEAEKVGRVVSSHVIPRAHGEVNDKILKRYMWKGESSGPQGTGSEKSKKRKGKAASRKPLSPGGPEGSEETADGSKDG